MAQHEACGPLTRVKGCRKGSPCLQTRAYVTVHEAFSGRTAVLRAMVPAGGLHVGVFLTRTRLAMRGTSPPSGEACVHAIAFRAAMTREAFPKLASSLVQHLARCGERRSPFRRAIAHPRPCCAAEEDCHRQRVGTHGTTGFAPIRGTPPRPRSGHSRLIRTLALRSATHGSPRLGASLAGNHRWRSRVVVRHRGSTGSCVGQDFDGL